MTSHNGGNGPQPVSQPRLLLVDDDPVNLEILVDYLAGLDYDLVLAEGGEQAIAELSRPGAHFDTVLLDRMMPRVDGMAVLTHIMNSPDLNSIPVIMQTAASDAAQISAGLRAGAWYYLTKPFERSILRALVDSAVSDHRHVLDMQSRIRRDTQAFALVRHAEFEFRTLSDVDSLAALVASACPDPDRVIRGLNELMLNAVEHGNLGISYPEKSALNLAGTWLAEVEHRLALPQYARKCATLLFDRSDAGISITITDEGPGFDWNEYLEISVARIFDSHGRGIAIARSLSFDGLEYLGNGNQVRVRINLDG